LEVLGEDEPAPSGFAEGPLELEPSPEASFADDDPEDPEDPDDSDAPDDLDDAASPALPALPEPAFFASERLSFL
jgi:hypothetical protein